MGRRLSRRTLLADTAAGAAAALTRFPVAAVAQAAPFKLGLLTVKTGPLATGGIQMEQGVLTYLKEKNYTLGGRKVDFISGDTGGNPAGAKTKAQELIERDKVDAIVGPLAAFELYAINDYVIQQKMPTLSLAAADNLTQRTPNPYLLRASATSSQATQPLGHFAATELKLKRVVTISEDFAFGHEQMGGFQASFQTNGGCVVNKLWPPLVTPDYTPYVAQIADCDGVCQGFAGSNPLRFMKAYASAGLKYPVIAGEAGADDFLLKSFGEEAIGLIIPLHARSRKRRQPSLHRRHAEELRRHSRPICGAALWQLPRVGCRPQGGRRRRQRQGKVYGGAQRREPDRYAARVAQIRSPQQRHWRHIHPSPRDGGHQIRPEALEQDHQDL
jgi:branched-chain amino acid transport system substrate-binding protein